MTTITTRAGKGTPLSWNEVDANFTNLNNDKAETTAVALKAPIDSPTFTGTPAAPTAVVGTNTTQVATTAFVNSEISNDALLKSGGTATGQIKGITPVAAEDLTRKDYVDTMLPKAGGTMTGVLSATTGLTVKSAATGSNDGNVVSGTYIPTYGILSNLNSISTALTCQYIRVGNVVTVSGQVSCTPTASSAISAMSITLPISNGNFTASEELSGTIHIDTGTALTKTHGNCFAYSGQVLGYFRWAANATTSNSLYFTFTYRII